MTDLQSALKERLIMLKAMNSDNPSNDSTPNLTLDDIRQSLIESKILDKNGKERKLIHS